MKIGEALALGSSLTDENMVFLKQLGVNYLSVYVDLMQQQMRHQKPNGEHTLSSLIEGPCYETDDLLALRKWVESYGLELSGINSMLFPRWEKMILGQSGRDEQIENWNKSLRNMRQAGIPVLGYGWGVGAGAWMPMWRTSAENIGRGGVRIVRFDYDVAKKAPLTNYGEISGKTLWDSLTYFLKAVIPVAEEAGVMMAMHPPDPQVPRLAGIARIVRSIEEYDKVFEIMPSRANSMVFCLGCFGQMMDADHVYEAIRHFGKEGRIGCVHFRGVRGTLEKFDEVFPDEGKLDMLQAVKVLKEVGFNGIIENDHAPQVTGDTEYGHMNHAFQIGYLRGIVQGTDAIL